MRLTARTLMGRRRFWLLIALAVVPVALAVGVRALVGTGDPLAWGVASGFGVATLVPLIALLTGTGSIGPEIDDGSIVYLLTKPIGSLTVMVSKLVVAALTAVVLGPVAVVLSAALLAEHPGSVVPPIALISTLAVLAYCVLFLLLSVLTRHAVVIGLLYAIVWETTIANLVPGARALSVRQWSLALGERLMGAEEADRLGVAAAVGPVTAAVALSVLVVAGIVVAARRLPTVRLVSPE